MRVVSNQARGAGALSLLRTQVPAGRATKTPMLPGGNPFGFWKRIRDKGADWANQSINQDDCH